MELDRSLFAILFVARKGYANCRSVLRQMCNIAIGHLLQSFDSKANIFRNSNLTLSCIGFFLTENYLFVDVYGQSN